MGISPRGTVAMIAMAKASAHFATTATLMYRIFGFQARYAQGFAVPASAFHEQPDGTYEAKVTGSMGHAWCETYQNGWTIREHTLPYHGEEAAEFSPAADDKQNSPVTDERQGLFSSLLWHYFYCRHQSEGKNGRTDPLTGSTGAFLYDGEKGSRCSRCSRIGTAQVEKAGI